MLDQDDLAPLNRKWVQFYTFDEEVDGIGVFYIDEEAYITVRGDDNRLQSIYKSEKAVGIRSVFEVSAVKDSYEPVLVQVYYKADSFFQGYLFIDKQDKTVLVVGDKMDLDEENHEMIFQKEFNYAV